ncbi:MAG: hypothetical protein NVS4B11_19310 [Ktedonobacteraceae bacterium]
MDGNRPWTVSFFTDINGCSPIEEDINKLPCEEQLAIDEWIEKIRVRNIFAREPLASHIEEDLWELRANRYRLIYCVDSDRCIIFLHIFRKTTRKTPQKAKKIARKRYKDYRSCV